MRQSWPPPATSTCFLMLLASQTGRPRTIIALYATATTLAGPAFVLVGRTTRAGRKLS